MGYFFFENASLSNLAGLTIALQLCEFSARSFFFRALLRMKEAVFALFGNIFARYHCAHQPSHLRRKAPSLMPFNSLSTSAWPLAQRGYGLKLHSSLAGNLPSTPRPLSADLQLTFPSNRWLPINTCSLLATFPDMSHLRAFYCATITLCCSVYCNMANARRRALEFTFTVSWLTY